MNTNHHIIRWREQTVDGVASIVPNHDGEWVKYEDVKSLKEDFKLIDNTNGLLTNGYKRLEEEHEVLKKENEKMKEEKVELIDKLLKELGVDNISSTTTTGANWKTLTSGRKNIGRIMVDDWSANDLQGPEL